ncbi:MAG: hypothetical protein M1831_003194 [Alyxoria varia]|nr:MAG: hypothetical protein M1831_003194 [Alyxoria varia]
MARRWPVDVASHLSDPGSPILTRRQPGPDGTDLIPIEDIEPIDKRRIIKNSYMVTLRPTENFNVKYDSEHGAARWEEDFDEILAIHSDNIGAPDITKAPNFQRLSPICAYIATLDRQTILKVRTDIQRVERIELNFKLDISLPDDIVQAEQDPAPNIAVAEKPGPFPGPRVASNKRKRAVGRTTAKKVVTHPARYNLVMISQQGPVFQDRDDHPTRPPFEQGYQHVEGAGKDVRAYVMDSGILATYPEFSGRVEPLFPYPIIVDEGLTTFLQDPTGHGTLVASALGGSTYGIAPNVTLVDAKFLTDQGDYTYGKLFVVLTEILKREARPWSRAERGAVINMSNSIILPDSRQTIDKLMSDLENAGVSFVVSARNRARADVEEWPCSDRSYVICVGNIDSQYKKANEQWFEDPEPSFVAPGKYILAINATKDAQGNPIGEEKYVTGTSFATPHVAGVVATILSQDDFWAGSIKRSAGLARMKERARLAYRLLGENAIATNIPGFTRSEKMFIVNNGINDPRKDEDDPFYIPEDIKGQLPENAEPASSTRPPPRPPIAPGRSSLSASFCQIWDRSVAGRSAWPLWLERLCSRGNDDAQ